MSIEQQCDRLSVGLSPHVDANEARLIGARALNVPMQCCSECGLEVVIDPQGGQRLAWAVGFRTGDAESGGSGTVMIDARSGEVLDSGKSW